jgi:hypothetical protein
MAHGNAVADRYRIKLKSRTSRFPNRLFDYFGNFIQVDMARYNLAEAVGYTDKRLVNIVVSEPARMKQSPVRRPLKFLLDRITSHNLPFS